LAPFIALTARESQMKFGKRPAEKKRIRDCWKAFRPGALRGGGAPLFRRLVIPDLIRDP
jgi:hypothetical protein